MSAADGFTLVVTPPPTPNGPLHVGHLSGPYVAGDIAIRAARAAGRPVLGMCGFDSNQNYVLARAEQLGEPVDAVVARFMGQIRDAMAAARIEYDIFLDPLADAAYRERVAGLLTELVESKAIAVEEATLSACSGCGRTLHHVRVSGSCPVCGQGAGGGTCEGCGSFLTAADLLDALSACCSAPPRPFRAAVPLLRLEEYRDRLRDVWSRAVLPERVRTLIGRYLSEGLPEVPLAYATDWGIPWRHGDTELRIDVWAEMALGYLYVIGRHFDPGVTGAADCVAAWSQVDELWWFLGIDNAFYYSTMIPALMLVAGLPGGPAGLVVNEFYRLDGLKFSTSRNHAIWAHEFLASEDPGVVRAYLSFDRPDRYGSDFTMASYLAFRDRYQAVLSGQSGAPLPEALADVELDRAAHALRLTGFDPALAVRAALAAYPTRPARAQAILDLVTGEGPRAQSRPVVDAVPAAQPATAA
jgi:methionyl-tRNA synthetase